MQWHWGNIGSALAGLSTLIIAAAALKQGPAAVRAWIGGKNAQAEQARQAAETTRLERQRYLHDWSRHGVDTYEVALVADADELARAAGELGGGTPTQYALIRTGSVSLGGSLRQMIESGGHVSRAPRAGELEALEAGLKAMGIAKATRSEL